MRTFRTFSRYWAFVSALFFLPWLQVTAAQAAVMPASCCADMPSMAAMPMLGSVQPSYLVDQHDSQASRILCQATCQDLSTALVPTATKAPRFQHAALVQHVVLVLQPALSRVGLRTLRTDPPPPSKPPFLAVRLLI
jgi:hypothetical protein